MKIEINTISLRLQKILKNYGSYIELLDDRLNYKHEFKAEEPTDNDDIELPWEKIMNCFERVVPKLLISSVDMEFVQATNRNENTDNYWKVYIQISGVNNDIITYFLEEKEAREYRDKIVRWLFNNPST